MTLHRMLRPLTFLLRRLNGAHGAPYWTAVGMVLFAVIFVGVGLVRIVEFNGYGFGRLFKTLLICLHICGCGLFAAALALFGLDSAMVYTSTTGILLGTGLLLLAPIHIYLGLLRRVHFKAAIKN